MFGWVVIVAGTHNVVFSLLNLIRLLYKFVCGLIFRISPSQTIGLICKIHRVGEDHLYCLNSTLELKGKGSTSDIHPPPLISDR